MDPKLVERFVTSQTWLEGLSDRLQPAVRDAVAGTGRRGADLLDGVWFGAPLHPALTDVPVGALTAAVTLDGVALATGSPAVDRQADGALAVSVAGALAAATTGLSDWRYTDGDARRLALGHGLLNIVGVALNATSLGLRLAGRRRAGQVSSALGFLVASAAAHLGGDLTFGLGVRSTGRSRSGSDPVHAGARRVPARRHVHAPSGCRRRSCARTRSTSGAICAMEHRQPPGGSPG